MAWSFGGSSYGRDEAEFVVERLYHALLRREPDRDGFYRATREVDAGRVGDVVASPFDSAEFRSVHRGATTAQLLDSIYRGLLGRAPDAGAIRAYRWRLADPDERLRVVLEILASREFSALLDRRVAAVDPDEFEDRVRVVETGRLRSLASRR